MIGFEQVGRLVFLVMASILGLFVGQFLLRTVRHKFAL